MKVGVVGLGTMGAGIAQLAVEAGLETVGREVTDELGQTSRGRIEHFLTRKLLLSGRLRTAIAASVAVGLIGATGSTLVRLRWPFLPTGPAIVLVMFASFVAAYAWSRVRRGGP